MIDIGVLPAREDLSNGSDINASGQIVGYSSVSGYPHAFLWSPDVANGTSGIMTDLGDLPGGTPYANATGINASGQIVGTSDTEVGYHAFLWTPTTLNGSAGYMLDLGALPASSNTSGASAINNKGEVVGASDLYGQERAFWWSAQEGMLDLNTLLND